MTLSKILSAALLATATFAAAPALALVPGSEHYRERGEQVERQAVAAGVAARPTRERSGALGAGGTFGYALAPRGGTATPINNNHYRDRADEQSRQQIQAR
jgi:hypothetical protein